MKILKCPNCSQGIVIDSIDYVINVRIKCSKCDFTDFEFSFNNNNNNNNNKQYEKRSFNNVDLIALIPTIEKYTSSLYLKKKSEGIDSLIHNIANEFNLKPLVIYKLFNIFLDKLEVKESIINETLFLELESGKISIDFLMERLSNIAKDYIHNSAKPEPFNKSNYIEFEVESLKKRYEDKCADLKLLKGDYKLLSIECKNLKEKLEETKKLLDYYKQKS